jgi:hypothetical protein
MMGAVAVSSWCSRISRVGHSWAEHGRIGPYQADSPALARPPVNAECRRFSGPNRVVIDASHARGRWFETSRAHRRNQRLPGISLRWARLASRARRSRGGRRSGPRATRCLTRESSPRSSGCRFPSVALFATALGLSAGQAPDPIRRWSRGSEPAVRRVDPTMLGNAGFVGPHDYIAGRTGTVLRLCRSTTGSSIR